MSIYCSFGIFDSDDSDLGDLSRRRRGFMGGESVYRSPIIYQGSHILPRPDDPRGGSLDFAHIPGFIARDGQDGDDYSGLAYWPYLRVSLAQHNNDEYSGSATVVLDVEQVDRMIEDLQSWRANVDISKRDK